MVIRGKVPFEIACHGKGKLTMLEGTIYEGEFINGICQKKGKLYFPNENTYEGELE